MKILQVALFCLFAAGCTSAPKLEYPTGKESLRQPINVLHPTLSETVPLQATPAGLNPEINGASLQQAKVLPPLPGTTLNPSLRFK